MCVFGRVKRVRVMAADSPRAANHSGSGLDLKMRSYFLLLPAGDVFLANSSDSPPSVTSTAVDLELLLGPRRQQVSTAVPMTVVYSLIFVTGLVGNVATCVVIARNRYMHTTTNYCLFNLAVSDLLMLLLGLPQETYTIWFAYPWIFGETFCVVR